MRVTESEKDMSEVQIREEDEIRIETCRREGSTLLDPSDRPTDRQDLGWPKSYYGTPESGLVGKINEAVMRIYYKDA